jgi:hypothetical protein
VFAQSLARISAPSLPPPERKLAPTLPMRPSLPSAIVPALIEGFCAIDAVRRLGLQFLAAAAYAQPLRGRKEAQAACEPYAMGERR